MWVFTLKIDNVIFTPFSENSNESNVRSNAWLNRSTSKVPNNNLLLDLWNDIINICNNLNQMLFLTINVKLAKWWIFKAKCQPFSSQHIPLNVKEPRHFVRFRKWIYTLFRCIMWTQHHYEFGMLQNFILNWLHISFHSLKKYFQASRYISNISFMNCVSHKEYVKEKQFSLNVIRDPFCFEKDTVSQG